jgi:adenosylmethionine-8-amino-7-oxononanoate aminotransferase
MPPYIIKNEELEKLLRAMTKVIAEELSIDG